jgi:ATP-dependent Clp protease ATP-binding subunit ClpC
VGTRDLKRGGGFGFGTASAKDEYGAMKSTIEDALKRVFNPEFLNRIDDTIVFHQLERHHIMQIIDIQMRDLVKRMVSMGISIQLNKQAKEFLAEKGFDPSFGARPLRRALQKYLEDPIAEELLKGKYAEKSVLRVKINKKTGELKFSRTTSAKNEGTEETEEKSADVS